MSKARAAKRRQRIRRMARERHVRRLARDALERLVGPPAGGGHFDHIPHSAITYKGPIGSIVYHDSFLHKHFVHWHRMPPAGTPIDGVTGGQLWGARCKGCLNGYESTNPTTAVTNIAHADFCKVDLSQGRRGP